MLARPHVSCGSAALPRAEHACWHRSRFGVSSCYTLRQTPTVANHGRAQSIQRHSTAKEDVTESTGVAAEEHSDSRANGNGSTANGSTGSASIDAGSGEKIAASPSWRWEESEDALKAFTVFAGVLLLGNVPLLASSRVADLPYFISLAVCTIYIGAHRSLNSQQRQTLSLEQGFLAPVFASVALFGAYLLITFAPDFDLRTFFNAYFWFIGSIAVVGLSAAPLRRLAAGLGQSPFKIALPEWLAKDSEGNLVTDLELAYTDFIALAAGVAVASVDLGANHSIFTLNNLLACAITTDILQLVGLKSFRAAAVMLIGLLVYDVFWVFGSPSVVGDNVMLKVATSDLFTGPTRLLFPRVAGGTGEAASFPFSLLGLGDIAVPGLLACLALRYDASRAIDMQARADAAGVALQLSFDSLDVNASDEEIYAAQKAAAVAAEDTYDRIADEEDASRARSQSEDDDGTPPVPVTESVLRQRTYFTPVMLAYILGLATAFVANSVTGLGQPALLYIVPFVLSAVVLTATLRGETSQLLKFTDRSTGVYATEAKKK